VDRGYTAASGDWDVDANWTPTAGIGPRPQSGDRAFIGANFIGGQALNANVTVDTNESAQTLSEIYVGGFNTNTGSGTLNINSGGTIKSNSNVRVGGQSSGVLNVNTGGTLDNLGGQIGVGFDTGGGQMTIAGGTVTGNRLFVGFQSNGTFNMSSGTLSLTGGLEGSVGSSGTSSIQITGGTLNVGNFAWTNNGSGAGTVGIANATITTTGSSLSGFGSGGDTITQTSGSVTVNGQLRIGVNANSAWSISGGSLSVVGNELWVGEGGAGTTRSLNISGAGTTVTAITNRALIGVFDGTSTVNQSNGTATFNDLQLGFEGSNTPVGIYNLSGGSLVTNLLKKNGNGSSAFNFTGGSLDANDIRFSVTNNGGALSPDLFDDVGTTLFTSGAGYTQSSGSLAIDLMSLASFDTVTVGGAASLNGTVSVNLVGAYLPTSGDFWDVLTASSAITDLGLLVTSTEGIFTKSYVSGGNTLRLTYVSAIPEPTSLSLLGLAGLALVRRRRA